MFGRCWWDRHCRRGSEIIIVIDIQVDIDIFWEWPRIWESERNRCRCGFAYNGEGLFAMRKGRFLEYNVG